MWTLKIIEKSKKKKINNFFIKPQIQKKSSKRAF
jgi:hypothetical protein